jgi:flagellar biosynthesis component FlhA
MRIERAPILQFARWNRDLHIGRMGFFAGIAFALIFFGIARYEHMSAWKWAIASFALTLTVTWMFPFSFIFILPAQFGLFLVLWWMNARRQDELKVERAALEAEDQRRRRERVSQAQAQADAELKKRDAERAAAEEAERQERLERVRLAREQREREEREAQGRGDQPTG